MIQFAKRLTLAAAFTVITSASVSAAEINWKMATIAPENSFVFNIFVKHFTDKVALWSNGELKIQPFGSGVLAHPFKLYDAVQSGQVDIAWSYPGFLVNADATNAILAGFPGGMAPETYMHWAFEGGGQQLWEDYRRDTMGLMSLYSGQGTTEIFAHSHKPVRTIEDLKGYKHRSTGAWASILKDSFGGAPTVTPFGEIFGMLQKKALDGVEYAGPGGNLALGYHKVAKYIIFPGAHQPSSSTEIFLKKENFDALPENLQQVVRDAAKATVMHTFLSLGHADQGAMEAYREAENELVRMEPSLVSAIQSAGRDWVKAKVGEQTEKGNNWAGKIYDSYTAYQGNWTNNSFTRAADNE